MLDAFNTMLADDAERSGQQRSASFQLSDMVRRFPAELSALSSKQLGLCDLVRIVDDGGEIRAPVYVSSADESSADEAQGHAADGPAVSRQRRRRPRHIRVSRSMPLVSARSLGTLTVALLHAAVKRDNRLLPLDIRSTEGKSRSQGVVARQDALLKILVGSCHEAIDGSSSGGGGGGNDQRYLDDLVAAVLASGEPPTTIRDECGAPPQQLENALEGTVLSRALQRLHPRVLTIPFLQQELFFERFEDGISTDEASALLHCDHLCAVAPFLFAYTTPTLAHSIVQWVQETPSGVLSALSSLPNGIETSVECFRWRVLDAFCMGTLEVFLDRQRVSLASRMKKRRLLSDVAAAQLAVGTDKSRGSVGVAAVVDVIVGGVGPALAAFVPNDDALRHHVTVILDASCVHAEETTPPEQHSAAVAKALLVMLLWELVAADAEARVGGGALPQ